MDTDSRLLAIDIGNTNVTLGLWYDGQWAACWRARTVRDKMPDEYAVLVRSFLEDAGLSYRDIDGVAISSVVPSLTLAFTELVPRYMNLTPLVVDHRTPTGIRIDIDEPQQAGPDRIVNAAAVHVLYGPPRPSMLSRRTAHTAAARLPLASASLTTHWWNMPPGSMPSIYAPRPAR